jgi:hypothetical protein
VTLGFVTPGLDELDRSGAILAEGQRCPIASINRSVQPLEAGQASRPKG